MHMLNFGSLPLRERRLFSILLLLFRFFLPASVCCAKKTGTHVECWELCLAELEKKKQWRKVATGKEKKSKIERERSSWSRRCAAQ